MSRRPKVSFFCRVESRDILDRVDFYAQDLRILADLGCDVDVAVSPRALRPADLYFGWWWTWGFAPTLLGKMLRRPVVLTGVFDAWKWPMRTPMARALHRFALEQATVNVFLSRFEHESMPRQFSVSRPEYCPLIVDTELYHPGVAGRESFLLCVAGSGMHGGNSERKCIAELIHAFARLRERRRDITLKIVGRQGSDFPRLLALARSLEVAEAIEFTGVVSVERKVELLQRCALYLQPSRFEGFGLSILEAMSCGAAVVTSPVGAVPELVGDSAELVEGTDPEALAAAVLGLLESDFRRNAMQAGARHRAETEYPYTRRRNYFARLLDELLT